MLDKHLLKRHFNGSSVIKAVYWFAIVPLYMRLHSEAVPAHCVVEPFKVYGSGHDIGEDTIESFKWRTTYRSPFGNNILAVVWEIHITWEFECSTTSIDSTQRSITTVQRDITLTLKFNIFVDEICKHKSLKKCKRTWFFIWRIHFCQKSLGEMFCHKEPALHKTKQKLPNYGQRGG